MTFDDLVHMPRGNTPQGTQAPAEQRAIAKAATPGPWEASFPPIYKGWRVEAINGDSQTNGGFAIAYEMIGSDVEANARHIATFDPPTILAMLDERAADKARIARLVEACHEMVRRIEASVQNWRQSAADATVEGDFELAKDIRNTVLCSLYGLPKEALLAVLASEEPTAAKGD